MGETKFWQCRECGGTNGLSKEVCEKCGVVRKVSSYKAVSERTHIDVGNEKVSTMCSWNDHGLLCSAYGVLSDSTTGVGPWYCREHYECLHGHPVRHKGNELLKVAA